MKYRKKPVVIDAVRWTDPDLNKYPRRNKLLIEAYNKGILTVSECQLHIKTLEGTMVANIGDYIIKGVKGEYYPCKADIFEATYEDV